MRILLRIKQGTFRTILSPYDPGPEAFRIQSLHAVHEPVAGVLWRSRIIILHSSDLFGCGRFGPRYPVDRRRMIDVRHHLGRLGLRLRFHLGRRRLRWRYFMRTHNESLRRVAEPIEGIARDQSEDRPGGRAEDFGLVGRHDGRFIHAVAARSAGRDHRDCVSLMNVP